MMEIKAQQFVTSTGGKSYDNGQQGMAAWRVSVPRPEKHQGRGGSDFCELRGTG
ncbi:hypothetical protein NYV48_26950 [Escherichia coli]|nr:hypothetical protein [Escherichia coli]